MNPEDHLAAQLGHSTLAAIQRAYEAARMDGLCHDGAWEIARGLLKAPPASTTLQALERWLEAQQ